METIPVFHLKAGFRFCLNWLFLLPLRNVKDEDLIQLAKSVYQPGYAG